MSDASKLKPWKYGSSWEKYPIKAGEIWREQTTQSQFQVWDLFDGLPDYMTHVDLIYCDPPWNQSNLNSFYTKAGLTTRRNYAEFLTILFRHIKSINPKVCYLEIGKQNIDEIIKHMEKIYPIVQQWNVTYYKKYPSFLVRGSFSYPTDVDFSGMDDMDTPRIAMEAEEFNSVGDLCAGRGLIPETAFKLKKQSISTELSRRRLAVAIAKIVKLGGRFDIESQ